MIRGGYILQPRLFDKSDASHLSPVTRELWFYLLRNVNHSDNGQHKRGSGFFSLSDIQDALCWYTGYRKNTYSKPQLTKALRRLCERTMVETAKATRGLHITICNYVEYQNPKNYEGNGEGSTKEPRRDLEGQTIDKNGKNEKNEKKDLKPITKKFTKPTLEEVTTYCQARGNSIDPQNFLDVNDAKGWLVGTTKSPMKDWKAAIRTWEKNNYNGNGKKTTKERIIDAFTEKENSHGLLDFANDSKEPISAEDVEIRLLPTA